MVKHRPIEAQALCEAVGGTVATRSSAAFQEPAKGSFTGLAEPLDAGSSDVAFFISESFLPQLSACRAGAIVLAKALFLKVDQSILPADACLIVTEDAYLGLARYTRLLVQENPEFDWTRKDAAPARVGARSVVHAGAVLGPGVVVGEDCVIFPNAVVYPHCEIGSRVRIHAGAVIGSDGFGYAKGPRGSEKIFHLGRVRIGDDVEIGAGAAVDRGTIRDTIIETGAKIDNLVQIGHNGHIKAHAILCAQVGLAGNATVGRGAILAGKAGVADKVEIGDGAIVGPMSGLSKDIPPGQIVMGQQPPRERKQWWKLVAYFDRLPELFERVKKLERERKDS